MNINKHVGKSIIYISLLILITICIKSVLAYNIYDENNPGSPFIEGGNGDGTGKPTRWPSPYLNSIRVRIFRGNSVLKESYFLLKNPNDNNLKDVGYITEVKVCTTSGYNYNSISDAAKDASCTTNVQSQFNFSGSLDSENLGNSWTRDSGNGNYLNDYLKNNSYKNLKETVLDRMGYNANNAQKGDKVIIEPATLVVCDNVRYFGTSTALMGSNINYSGVDGHQCNNTTTTNAPYADFMNVYSIMSTALQTAGKPSCPVTNKGGGQTGRLHSEYSGCGYFQYNIDDIFNPPDPGDPGDNPTPTKYTLKITKKDSTTNSPISGVKFTLSGNGISPMTCTTNINGVCEITGIPASTITYALTETLPSGYEAGSCVGCISMSGRTMRVLINSDKSITVTNKKSCQSELESLGSNPTRNQLVTLYNKYKKKGLLDFSNPTCTNNATPNYNKKYGCMYADISISNFNENNLSGFEEEITLNNNYTAFCGHTFNFSNVLGITNNHYFGKIKSGQMLLNLKEPKIGEGTVTRTCYVFGTPNNFTDNKDYSKYVGSVSLNDNELTNELLDTTSNSYSGSGYSVFTYTYKKLYNLPSVYSKIGTGETSFTQCFNCRFLGYGYVTKLDSETTTIRKTIPFRISDPIGNTIANDNTSCTYDIFNEILNNELNLKYRSVDVEDSFPGKSGNTRKAGTNWTMDSLDINGDGKFDASDYNIVMERIDTLEDKYDINRDGNIDASDLTLMNEYISTGKDLYSETIMQNTPNRYGIIPKTNAKVEPKYVITLTPQTIQEIRNYNSGTTYDDFNMTCDSEGKICTSNYLTTLISRNVVTVNNSSKRS